MDVSRREFFREIVNRDYLKYISLFVPSGLKRALHAVDEKAVSPEDTGRELGKRKSPVLEKILNSNSSNPASETNSHVEISAPEDIGLK